MSKTTINIKSLIGTLVIVNTNKEETAEQITERITGVLLKAINNTEESSVGSRF